jgi:hypothetical protein
MARKDMPNELEAAFVRAITRSGRSLNALGKACGVSAAQLSRSSAASAG